MLNKVLWVVMCVGLGTASVACGKGDGGGGGGDARAQCEKIWERATKMLANPNPDKKGPYLDKCATLPPKLIECRATNAMNDECGKVISENRDKLMELSSLL
jgi:hypothetical protein